MLKTLAKRIIRGRELPDLLGKEAGPEWMDMAYSQSEEYRKPYWQSRYYFVWSVIADRLRRYGANRVLEIGCGPGQLAAMLVDAGVADQYTGLDFSPVAIGLARELHCPHRTFIVDDARTSDVYETAPYDATICTEVLEHIDADLELVSRFKGRCICTVPNFPYLSHVRHFTSAQEVIDRYGPLFDDFDVVGLRGQRTQIYWLFDGVRRS